MNQPAQYTQFYAQQQQQQQQRFKDAEQVRACVRVCVCVRALSVLRRGGSWWLVTRRRLVRSLIASYAPN